MVGIVLKVELLSLVEFNLILFKSDVSPINVTGLALKIKHATHYDKVLQASRADERKVQPGAQPSGWRPLASPPPPQGAKGGGGGRVWGLGFGVWGLGFGVWGLGFRVSGLGFRV